MGYTFVVYTTIVAVKMRIEDEIKQASFKNEVQKVNLNIQFTGGWLNAHTSQILKPFNLSPEQFNVLRILRGSPGKSANLCEIQGRMVDRMSNATRLVEKLRIKGFLTRDLCQENRRKVDIHITPEGLNLLEKVDQVLTEMMTHIGKNLTEEEARSLNMLLDKLRQ